MNEITATHSGQLMAREDTLLNKETFQQIAEIAWMMASSSLIPESLCMTGSGNTKELLPFERVRANCFLVANQAIKWGADPFAVAQCASVVHGRLMFEGKLVAAIVEGKLGFKLAHVFGKWDKERECCIPGEDAKGEDLAIRIGQPRKVHDDGTIEFVRYVDGHVAGWKTSGNNTPWRVGNFRKMLIYRGTREFARIHEPGLMLGVITDDEYDPAYSARDITPPSSGAASAAGRSIIDRLRENQSAGSAGFDQGRVNEDIDSARPPRAEAVASSQMDASAGAGAVETSAPDNQNSGQPSSPADVAEESAPGTGAGAGSAPLSEDEMVWLRNVTVMLWAATNPNGDESILVAQRKAAAASYPPEGKSQAVLDKAKAVFNRCMTVVKGEVEPGDGIEIIGGIVGSTPEEIAKLAKK